MKEINLKLQELAEYQKQQFECIEDFKDDEAVLSVLRVIIQRKMHLT